jgi:hypothetical protein
MSKSPRTRVGFVRASAAALGVAVLAGDARAAITTTVSGVYDEQVVNQNAVDVAASGTVGGTLVTVTVGTHGTRVAAAYAAGTGGVIHFDDTTEVSDDSSIVASMPGGGVLTITGSTGYKIDRGTNIGSTPISGNTYLRNSSTTQTYNFSLPLSDLAVTVLARNASRTITATVTYDDNSTGSLSNVAVATNTGSGATSSPDTFFGFEAPAGRTIKSLVLAGGTNGFFAVDDLSFVSVPEPGTLAVVGLAGAGLWGRRRRRR